LDVDFQFGLDDAAIARCADYLFRPPPDSYYLRPPEPGSVATLALQPLGEERDFNSERMRRAVLPAVNGHTNGRSLARLFAPLALGGTWNGVTLADQALIERFRSLQWEGDADLGYVHFRMGLGLLLGDPGRDTDFGPNPRAFGCPGTGGILGMADPEARLSYGYSPNNGSPAKGLGPRNRRLITALYRCL
jgi:CubicO group peptidase (beta-lactamase class C family)